MKRNELQSCQEEISQRQWILMISNLHVAIRAERKWKHSHSQFTHALPKTFIIQMQTVQNFWRNRFLLAVTDNDFMTKSLGEQWINFSVQKCKENFIWQYRQKKTLLLFYHIKVTCVKLVTQKYLYNDSHKVHGSNSFCSSVTSSCSEIKNPGWRHWSKTTEVDIKDDCNFLCDHWTRENLL